MNWFKKIFNRQNGFMNPERRAYFDLLSELGTKEKKNQLLYFALKEACNIAREARPEAQYSDPNYYINLAESKFYRRHEISK